MKKNWFSLSVIFLAVMLAMGVSSCKKDDDKTALTLSELKTGDIDMNGATAPNNVPAEPTITATFSTDVDAATATATNITLMRDYDQANIPVTITSSGKTITIVPSESLASGALHKLTLGAGIKSTEGEALGTAIERIFTTDGFFAPSGMIAYWDFNGDGIDKVGSYDAAVSIDITYVDSRKVASGKAASFNGTTSIMEIPGADALMNTNDFTLSFWAKAQQAGHGHFIMGLAAFHGFQFELFGGFNGFKMPVQFDFGDGTSGTGGDLSYNGDGKTLDNGGWRGTVVNKEDANLPSQLEDKWFHIVYVYNSNSKERAIFLNGEKVIMQDHDLWFDDDGNPYPETGIVGLKYNGTAPETLPELAFGFVHSRGGTLWDTEPWGGYDFPDANHFKGQLDDVRIFHKPLTEAEILLMYNSEK
ncbi:MAG: Ig-like domain-containing protein [Lentimicrobium sp.]|uniref:Ig-like domain-containing protein n=1 Tax=Lentimicrobium sp. TaxID=2034841 RepID=UPI0025E8CDB4|nr:Ig-like domain-containing protein [Lentimicrobium sp.]MCO5258138.1 Ig-like domain-containing protein [Lentimicrobium sp.]MCO5263357.1 Ig-like domain-containing protein [Lentimicrobium sp.]HPG34655.1 Ig-like domain-containing protein [Lentimicrobium sp.]